MAAGEERFVGGSQEYLREVQYRDGSRLAQRANLHVKYRTAPLSVFDWVGGLFDLFEDASVLEVGCGTGWLWQESGFDVPSGVTLTLTDLSAGMVAEALSRVEGSGRVEFVAGQTADVQHLPFVDGSFDRVVANHMLYHVPDPAAGVAEMARVLRRDGMVIASTNGRRHLRELWEIRSAVFDTPVEDEGAATFGPEIGLGVLRRYFSDVRWVEYPDELRCTDPADVLAHICSTPPADAATPEEINKLTQQVQKAFERGDGQLTVTKDVGSFVARNTQGCS